jgi:hypothetical protein
MMIIKLLGLTGHSKYTGRDLTVGNTYNVYLAKQSEEDIFGQISMCDTLCFLSDDAGDKATTHVKDTQYEIVQE